jgi:hypothetical protein
MANYYNYYKKKKKTKPFKFIKHRTYKIQPKKSYQELKAEHEEKKDDITPISQETFSIILKAALNYAKANKN